MPDTFPGLDADALALGQKAADLIRLTRELRAQCARGDADAVRAACKDIAKAADEIGEMGDAFQATTDHFVTYED